MQANDWLTRLATTHSRRRFFPWLGCWVLLLSSISIAQCFSLALVLADARTESRSDPKSETESESLVVLPTALRDSRKSLYRRFQGCQAGDLSRAHGIGLAGSQHSYLSHAVLEARQQRARVVMHLRC